MKWKKRKRESNLGNTNKRQKNEEEDDEEEEDEELEEEHDSPLPTAITSTNPDPNPNKEIETISEAGIRISDFPAVIKRVVNRHHSSVLSLVALERYLSSLNCYGDENSRVVNGFFLENISHGQLQALSSVPSDSPLLASVLDHSETSSSSSYVCTPPPIMEGKGIVRRFGSDHIHIGPMHADWFSPMSINRLERQILPHYFSGKSNDHTPEKYAELRNWIVTKYMENPKIKLTSTECQELVNAVNFQDLNRLVRFLDHWGIINYCAATQNKSSSEEVQLKEDANGDLHVPTAQLKSIDSLIQFDRPKCRLNPEDIISSTPSDVCENVDLDRRIRERMSENYCNHCNRPVPHAYYQSQKEADVVLCSDCFCDGKFIVGHASLDFTKVDSARTSYDTDGDSWTNQETLLLLEALEIYGDNWNGIVEHVGSKSKAQCILQFIRLPVEGDLLENIDISSIGMPCDRSKKDDCDKQNSVANGNYEDVCFKDSDSESRLPFVNSPNPVMALVAFLASSVGPRVAAACAHASLEFLSKENLPSRNVMVHMEGSAYGDRIGSKNLQKDGSSHVSLPGRGHQNEEETRRVGSGIKKDVAGSPLSSEIVRAAARIGLSAAAMKAKLFADHEEREIQRLAATAINHQLKRLELKLKQYTEVETSLMKGCDQVEKTRQRHAEERAHIISTRFGSSGLAIPEGPSNSNSNRPSLVSTHAPLPSMPSYGNSQSTHPQMPFIPRQQLFSFGPRLPLSMINPSSAPSSSSPANTNSLAHSMLRPVSGINTNLG